MSADMKECTLKLWEIGWEQHKPRVHLVHQHILAPSYYQFASMITLRLIII